MGGDFLCLCRLAIVRVLRRVDRLGLFFLLDYLDMARMVEIQEGMVVDTVIVTDMALAIVRVRVSRYRCNLLVRCICITKRTTTQVFNGNNLMDTEVPVDQVLRLLRCLFLQRVDFITLGLVQS